MSPLKSFSGTLIDDEFRLSLEDLCHACHQERGWVITLIEEGILQPRGKGPSDWFFDNLDMLHARQVMRLQRDHKEIELKFKPGKRPPAPRQR